MKRSTLYLAGRAVVALAALVGMGLSAIAGWANLLEHVGDSAMQQAAQGMAKRTSLAEGAAAYRRAARLEPLQPSHVFKLGLTYETSAILFPPLSEDARTAWASAAESYRLAVHRHPANARLQASLAVAALHAGDPIGGGRAVRAALKLAPDYPDVRFMVAGWYLMQWEALSPEQQRLATSLVYRGARELPELYVNAVWQLVRNPQAVRQILPGDARVRRLLLNKLTERGLFAERWAELAVHPEFRVSAPAAGVHMLASGILTGPQGLPRGAVPAGGPWRGMVAGWLSGGLTASMDLNLPPGEVVLYLPVRGEEAAGIWPVLQVTLGGRGLPLPTVNGPGWRIAYLLISTPGGRLPLQAILSNGAVVKEHGQFVERRVTLGPVEVLIPSAGASS